MKKFTITFFDVTVKKYSEKILNEKEKKMKKLGIVFWVSAVVAIFAATVGLIAPEMFETVTGNVQSFLTTSFGWYYLLTVAIIVAFCLFLILSPVGGIR